MFNANQLTPLSSPMLANPPQTLGAGPTGSAPFLPSPTTAAPPLHAAFLTPAPLAAPGTSDMDILIDQPSAALDDVMMTDDRMGADDDPMTGGGGAESDSEMMIDEHDNAGSGAATPMSVSMGGDADVDVEMVASDVAYNVSGAVDSPVAVHQQLQQQQQQLAFGAQFVQQQAFAAAVGLSPSSPMPTPFQSLASATPTPVEAVQEVYFMQDAALSGGAQERQEQEQLSLPTNSPAATGSEAVVDEDLLDYIEEHHVEGQEQVTGQVESAVTEPQATSFATSSAPTPTDNADPAIPTTTAATESAEAPITTTAQSSPHSHPHDPDAEYYDDGEAHADEYYDDANAYYDEEDDGEMPHVTLSFNGVTYAVFPPLAVAEQEGAITLSSSPSSPSHPPLFPTADGSELGSIRDGTINDFMWRIKERFELGEDMDVALKYVNLDGIMIREETSIGYDNQFDSFWSLYMALYPSAADPLHIEVLAELSAAAKLDMLLYRAQYPDESEAGAESPSSSSSPAPPLPVDAGAGVDEPQTLGVDTPGLTQVQPSAEEQADEQEGVASKLDDGAGQSGQHFEVVEQDVGVADGDLDFQEPEPNQAQDAETSTHQQQQQQEQAIGTEQDHKYVDDYQADLQETQHQEVVPPPEEFTSEDAAHVGEVQDFSGDEHQGAELPAQEQQSEAEAVVLEPEISQATEFNIAAPNPDTYEPAAPEPTSIDAPEQQPQQSVHQHFTSEELLDWVEDEAVNEPTPEQLISNGPDDNALVSSAAPYTTSSLSSSPSLTVGHESTSSHAAVSAGIPPSPAPTVDPLMPAPGSAPASRPSSPTADPAAGMVGDPLVTGETAPAATNGSMKRSLEMVDTDDFDPCTEPEAGTPYKRLRTSEEHN